MDKNENLKRIAGYHPDMIEKWTNKTDQALTFANKTEFLKFKQEYGHLFLKQFWNNIEVHDYKHNSVPLNEWLVYFRGFETI